MDFEWLMCRIRFSRLLSHFRISSIFNQNRSALRGICCLKISDVRFCFTHLCVAFEISCDERIDFIHTAHWNDIAFGWICAWLTLSIFDWLHNNNLFSTSNPLHITIQQPEKNAAISQQLLCCFIAFEYNTWWTNGMFRERKKKHRKMESVLTQIETNKNCICLNQL